MHSHTARLERSSVTSLGISGGFIVIITCSLAAVLFKQPRTKVDADAEDRSWLHDARYWYEQNIKAKAHDKIQ